MAAFEPKNPGYRAAAVACSNGQPAMRTLGIVIVRLAPGEVELAMLHSPEFTQQNGFVHAGIITAGLDNACGVAAFTLMPPRPISSPSSSRPRCSHPPAASVSSSRPRWSSRAVR